MSSKRQEQKNEKKERKKTLTMWRKRSRVKMRRTIREFPFKFF